MTISKRYIEVEIDGAAVKFHKLTPYDRAEIAEKVRKEQRAQLEAALVHMKDPNQVTVELATFDKEFPKHSVMRPYIITDSGQLDVFARALRRELSEDAAKEVLKKFTPDEDESFELAASLAGVKLSPVAAAQSKTAEDTSAYGEAAPPGDEANPPKPEEDSYSTPPAQTPT